MADRATFNGTSSEVPWKNTAAVPEGFGDQYARHVKALYDASVLPLTAIGGTAANVTAQVDPVISGGLLDGMKFTLTWGADSAGPTTLKIGSLAAAPVVDASGGALIAGSVKAGQRSLLEYVGGSFRLLGGAGGDGMQGRFFFQFTASGTFTKPAGLDPDTMVLLEVWGGGGGGGGGIGSGGGGGGGGYARRWLRAADVPSSVSVTIGAGGNGGPAGNNSGSNGGSTSFGSLLTATGGQGASNDGGGGGGLSSRFLGAPGGTGAGLAATHDFGGGAGAGASSGASPYGGGRAIYGGGGGGGAYNSTASGPRGPGGVSEFGGAGGDGGRNRADTQAMAGQAPGGGGGGSGGNGPGGNGARGEARIWIL